MAGKAISMQDGMDDEARWQAVSHRDRSFDGNFVFGVLSTGIYCRPSCAARRPERRNVRFYDSPELAAAAGFRACKRCRPQESARDDDAVADALAILEAAQERVPLAHLAQVVGYSPAHFQRVFKRVVGLSPAAYGRALRGERVRQALSKEETVTDAIYEAGYGAPSRFYDATRERLGMAPSVWRDGGRGVTIHWAVTETTFGPMLVAASEKGVCRLSFGEDGDALAARFPNARLVQGGAEFAHLIEEVVGAVETPGSGSGSAIPIDVRGTAFQEAVWQELRKIPPGETRSYAQIAAAVGKPGAVRAAGSANGANHVSVLIPCHRVVRSDGSLGGYAWGLDIKRELLRREREAQ